MWVIYGSAIIIAPNVKEVREIAFKNFYGDETSYDLKNHNSNYSKDYINNIWKNSKYTNITKNRNSS